MVNFSGSTLVHGEKVDGPPKYIGILLEKGKEGMDVGKAIYSMFISLNMY